jgi:16S rRNA (guanine966-N2)-methyltransferase
VRFTGGEARGRSIRGPRGPGIRPTSDRVREALFDVLATRVSGASFLDVFAGTGAVGLEALSRGASRAVFLERDRGALRLIRENLRLGPWEEAVEILPGDALHSLAALRRRGERFSVIFLDPPYDHPRIQTLLEAASPLLGGDGLLVIEHRSSGPLPVPQTPRLVLGRSYRHGDTRLTTYRPAREEP